MANVDRNQIKNGVTGHRNRELSILLALTHIFCSQLSTFAFTSTITVSPTTVNYPALLKEIQLTPTSDRLLNGNAFKRPEEFHCRPLNKDSKYTDVLEYLKDTRRVAPYVAAQGVAVVTGGSSGIGLQTVEALASTGMKVVLCARDPFAALQALRSKKLDKSPFIRIQPLDLADLESVQAAAENIANTEGQISVILNNAGVNSIQTQEKTAQGVEMHLGVNHVGHFYFTRMLLGNLRQGGRVVTVSSKAYSTVKRFNSNERDAYSPWVSYARSKLANIMFAKELQERLDEADINAVSLSLHPGLVQDSKLWRHNDNALVGAVSDYIVTKTPEQGAANNVFCCLADASHFPQGGEFVSDCRIEIPKTALYNAETRRQLWEDTENVIRKAGFALPKLQKAAPVLM